MHTSKQTTSTTTNTAAEPYVGSVAILDFQDVKPALTSILYNGWKVQIVGTNPGIHYAIAWACSGYVEECIPGSHGHTIVCSYGNFRSEVEDEDELDKIEFWRGYVNGYVCTLTHGRVEIFYPYDHNNKKDAMDCIGSIYLLSPGFADPIPWDELVERYGIHGIE